VSRVFPHEMDEKAMVIACTMSLVFCALVVKNENTRGVHARLFDKASKTLSMSIFVVHSHGRI